VKTWKELHREKKYTKIARGCDCPPRPSRKSEIFCSGYRIRRDKLEKDKK
jgi:hypothetical protein